MTFSLIEQDQKQRALALDATQSFIVQAPAGSGKTELLVQRFLVLLAGVNTPEEILAITFTKKAANEMRARLLKTLKQAQSEPEPSSTHAKKTWQLAQQVLKRDATLNWQILVNPNQLRIQTIDALCTYLTKQLPLLSHFGSSPEISENPLILYRLAVQEVLTHIEENVEWSNDLAKLLLHLDNDLNKLHDLLVSLLAKRDQWLSYIHLDTSDAALRLQLEKQIALVIDDHLTLLDEIFPKEHHQELIAITYFTCPDITIERQAAWVNIARLLLTNSFTWRKRVDEKIGFPALKSLKNPAEKALHQSFRQRHAQLIEHLQTRDDLRQALADVIVMPEPHYDDAQWDILKALLHILKIVAAQLRVIFQQYGQIDFIENAQGALTALGNDEHPTDLTLALDYRIQHILVDEFQDTSYTQYHLLEKLTYGWQPNDGRTLFVVGDPMQSIYRFREAEVGLFIRMRKTGIGQCRLTPLTLSLNFRSAPAIVE